MSSVHRTSSGIGAGKTCMLYCMILFASVSSCHFVAGQACDFDLVTADLEMESRHNDLNYRSVTNASWNLGAFFAVLENRDLQKAGSSINHTISMDPLGGHQLPYIISLRGDKRSLIDVVLSFSNPVDFVSFVILDIDRDVNWDWQDSIQLTAYSKNDKISPAHYRFGYDRNNVFKSPSGTSFTGLRNQVDNVGTLGNLSVEISGSIDSIRLRYAYTNDARIRSGSEQHIGLSQIKIGSQDLCEAPILKKDRVCTEKGSTSEIPVLDNDFIRSPDTASLRIIDPPKNGVAHVDFSKGSIGYTPGSKFYVTDSLSYVICNQNGVCGDTTIVSIMHDPVQSFYINSDINITSKERAVVGNVLTNDFDYNNALLSVRTNFLVPPLYGRVSINNDGSYVYTPDVGFVGKDQFSVLVCRGANGASCVKSRVDVLVLDHCFDCIDPLQGLTDHYSYPMGQIVQGNVLANDVYNRSLHKDLIVNLVNAPSNGTVALEPNGDFIYTPTPNRVSEDFFFYEICNYEQSDCSAFCDTVEVLFKPLYLDDQCHQYVCHLQDVVITSCVNDIVESTLHDKVLMYSNQSVAFTEKSMITPSQGRASIRKDGKLFYTPAPDYVGKDQFEYEVCFKNFENTQVQGQTQTNLGRRAIWTFRNIHEDDLQIGVEGLITSVDLTSLDLSGVSQNEVELTLISPNNTEVVLYLGQCASGTLENISFSDKGQSWTSCPFTNGSTYQPIQSLAKFNGEELKGNWKLVAKPLGPTPSPNTVFLDDWTLKFQIRPLSIVGCQKATVYVDVSKNAEPQLMPDSAVAIQGECIDVAVLENDVDDIGFDPSSSKVTVQPKNGTASMFNGQLRYCPDAFFIGTDTMEYSIEDYACLCGKGVIRSARVVIEVYAPLSVDHLKAQLTKDSEDHRRITWNFLGNLEPDEFQILRLSNLGIDTFCVIDLSLNSFTDAAQIAGELYYVVEALSLGQVIARSNRLSTQGLLSESRIYYHSEVEHIIWRFKDERQVSGIRIIDQLGRVVHTSKSYTGKVEVSNWPRGLYVVSYQERGRSRFKKLIIR